MQKVIISISIVVLIVVGGFFALNSYIYNEKQADPVPSEHVELFQSELTSYGIQKVGRPIEGFDAFLLLQAFQRLEEYDFDGVVSFGGIYSYVNGELEYTPIQGEPRTSAEQTISDEGYEMLLVNVAGRLRMSIESQEDVQDLVDRIK